MQFKLNTFLTVMEGSWISQKTIYYLKTNQICCNEFKYIIKKNKFSKNNLDISTFNKSVSSLEYYNTNQKQKKYYVFSQNNQDNLGLIKIHNNKNLDNYKYSIYKHNCLKIEYKTANIEYIEYIYTINQTFTINISLLKKVDKYIAISFSSNIKMTALDHP